MEENTEPQKLRVLCLHGYRQNGEIFRQKTGSLRKFLKNYVEFVFVDAPHIPKTDLTDPDDPSSAEKTWWFTGADKTYVSKNPSDIADGFDESIELLQNFVDEQGPFDGIFGFSQGAALGALLCALQQKNLFMGNFKFAILVSGFKSLCAPHAYLYTDQIELPCLHVLGDNDEIISRERSVALLEHFSNATVVTHVGGHYIPASKEFQQSYIEFIKQFM